MKIEIKIKDLIDIVIPSISELRRNIEYNNLILVKNIITLGYRLDKSAKVYNELINNISKKIDKELKEIKELKESELSKINNKELKEIKEKKYENKMQELVNKYNKQIEDFKEKETVSFDYDKKFKLSELEKSIASESYKCLILEGLLNLGLIDEENEEKSKSKEKEEK
ncbi:MAG: hypothetical protein BV457_00125 [Thermoplasmata archaeon M9B1D]|nr:MAG: hypothetical protein BV457_00125 [Thermoplasmata archaeon M9B1D]PNX52229.1 MAG: hypothetical protein BV456_00170 [Thermoplasmata archaeon M8B2D]